MRGMHAAGNTVALKFCVSRLAAQHTEPLPVEGGKDENSFGMAKTAVADKPAYPVDIGLLGAQAVVHVPQSLAHLV